MLDHDHAPVHLDLGILSDGLRLHYIRLSRYESRVRRLDAGQSLLDSGLVVGHAGTGCIDVCECLIDLRLERRGVDPSNQLAFGYLGVEIGEQFEDDARHLRADLHGDDGVRVAGTLSRGRPSIGVRREVPKQTADAA